MEAIAINDRDFAQVCELALRHAGISLSAAKKPLVQGRLKRRLAAYGLTNYGEYLQILLKPGSPELQTAIDLLTTNETSFFREPKHFEHLRRLALAHRQNSVAFRAWSAACSSGEEPYTIAMVLADALGSGEWEVVASDLSTRVLAQARTGHYALERANTIPRELLHRYCLKGIGTQENTFLIDAVLRRRVRFRQANLLTPASSSDGLLDVIFLRNVMFYFDAATKARVISNLLPVLRPGGTLYIGHSETLNGVTNALEMISPSVYRKPQ